MCIHTLQLGFVRFRTSLEQLTYIISQHIYIFLHNEQSFFFKPGINHREFRRNYLYIQAVQQPTFRSQRTHNIKDYLPWQDSHCGITHPEDHQKRFPSQIAGQHFQLQHRKYLQKDSNAQSSQPVVEGRAGEQKEIVTIGVQLQHFSLANKLLILLGIPKRVYSKKQSMSTYKASLG